MARPPSEMAGISWNIWGEIQECPLFSREILMMYFLDLSNWHILTVAVPQMHRLKRYKISSKVWSPTPVVTGCMNCTCAHTECCSPAGEICLTQHPSFHMNKKIPKYLVSLCSLCYRGFWKNFHWYNRHSCLELNKIFNVILDHFKYF